MGECFSKRSKEKVPEENVEDNQFEDNDERSNKEDDVNEYMKRRNEGNVKEMMKYLRNESIIQNRKIKILSEMALVDIYKAITNDANLCLNLSAEDTNSLIRLIGEIKQSENIEKSKYITFDFSMLILNKVLTNKPELITIENISFLISHITFFKGKHYKHYKLHLISSLQIFRSFYLISLSNRNLFLDLSGFQCLSDCLHSKEPNIVLEVLYCTEDLIYDLNTQILLDVLSRLIRLNILKMFEEQFAYYESIVSKTSIENEIYKKIEFIIETIIHK